MEPNQSLFDLQVDQQSISYLNESGRWARFIGIVGFIFCGLMVLCSLMIGAIMNTVSTTMGGSPLAGLPSAFFTVYLLAVAIISFVPCLFLFRFGSQAKAAVASNQQDKLVAALSNLKSYFKFVGIVLIIILSLYALVFVGALVGGLLIR